MLTHLFLSPKSGVILSAPRVILSLSKDDQSVKKLDESLYTFTSNESNCYPQLRRHRRTPARGGADSKARPRPSARARSCGGRRTVGRVGSHGAERPAAASAAHAWFGYWRRRRGHGRGDLRRNESFVHRWLCRVRARVEG